MARQAAVRRSTFEIPAAHPVLRRTRGWRGATAGVVLANVPPGHPPSVLPRQLPVARSVRAALQTDQYTHSTSLQLLTLAYTVALATRDEVRKTENTAGPSNPPQCQSARAAAHPTRSLAATLAQAVSNQATPRRQGAPEVGTAVARAVRPKIHERMTSSQKNAESWRAGTGPLPS